MIARISEKRFVSTNGVVRRDLVWTDFVILCVLIPMVIVAIIGAAIPAAFWGIWYLLAGSIPKVLGFSRFWLDMISGIFYAMIVMSYATNISENCRELSEDGEYRIFFGDFVSEYPRSFLLGIFLVIDFVFSIFFSFAAGLAGCIALAIVILASRGIWWIAQNIMFAFFHAIDFST